MKKPVNIKKIILPNLPYLLFALLGTKCGQAARLAPGLDFSQKALHILDGFRLAFESLLPSFHPADLLVGLLIAAALRLAVYVKGKNAKKFRKNMEYGSARWGAHEDIAPYIDPVFENNIILTQTESLTMNNRPKDPRTARNKNVLVIGGSGSGKTRFFIKPKTIRFRSSSPTRRAVSWSSAANCWRGTITASRYSIPSIFPRVCTIIHSPTSTRKRIF